MSKWSGPSCLVLVTCTEFQKLTIKRDTSSFVKKVSGVFILRRLMTRKGFELFPASTQDYPHKNIGIFLSSFRLISV